MGEKITVSKTYFDGLQRSIRHMIRQFCNWKESLDDADIKALEGMIKVYKNTDFERVKKWSSDRELFFKERVGVVTEQSSMDVCNLADD